MAAGAGAEPRVSYDIDARTGETSARHTDGDGTTTTMRSGEKVPVALPAGFAVYPGASVTNNLALIHSPEPTRKTGNSEARRRLENN